MDPKQTLEVGDYFTFNDVLKGGYYKVIAKTGNIYFVWCNYRLEPECHGMFGECPFKEQDPNIEKQCTEDVPLPKIEIPGKPQYGGPHYTCMMIDPAEVTKVPKLKGLMDLEV